MSDTSSDSPPAGAEADEAQAAPAPPVIPWQKPRGKGAITAFWQTVFVVLRRNGRLGEYLAGPVSYHDARTFRWLVIAHSLALPAAAFFVLTCANLAGGSAAEGPAKVLLVRTGLTVLMLPVLTGIVSWFFCPRRYDTEMQNRSIALSCYTCAPLVLWTFLLPLLGLPGLVVDFFEHPHVPLAILAVGVGLVELWWFQLILFAVSDVADRDGGGVVATVVLLPGAWLLVLIILGVLVPGSAAMLVLMWGSLGP